MNQKFLKSCYNGKIDIVKQLLPQIDPSIQNNYAIRYAAENGYPDVVELLLKDSRVDPSAHYNWAIRWAALNGHKDVVELLLRINTVDPFAEDNWAIKWAAEYGHKDIVEVLEQHQYKIDNVRYNEMAKLK